MAAATTAQTGPAQPGGNLRSRVLADEEPRAGVFLCAADGDLPAKEVLAYARELPGVAMAQVAAGPETIAAAIEDHKLNRIVVAGGNGRLDAGPYEATLHNAGLDDRLLRCVSLREQVLYPHASALPSQALYRKACSLVAMAVASLTAMRGLDALSTGGCQSLAQRALVVGGGAAGMSAALALAALDIHVDLLEREPQLGGQWRAIRHQADGSDAQAALATIQERVAADPRIHIHLNSHLRSIQGHPGAYLSLISSGEGQQSLHHGAVVLATGGSPARTTEYLYGQHPNVISQRDLEERPSTADLNTVVMIQCAGSREPERPYCSRICCTQAVKNALRLKAENPNTQIYVLYRDVRTFGFREEYYRAARNAGVLFIRYDLSAKPQVSANGQRLRVTLREPVTAHDLSIDADAVVLSVGIETEQQQELADQLGLALDPWGFFQEEHPKMKPLDLGNGIYVAGLAHSPRFLDEALVQGQAAAMRAAAWLSQRELRERATSVWVEERLCSFCGLCVEACPYHARVMDYDNRVATVDYALCQGCGACAMVCPNKATKQKGFEQRQLIAEVDWALT